MQTGVEPTECVDRLATIAPLSTRDVGPLALLAALRLDSQRLLAPARAFRVPSRSTQSLTTPRAPPPRTERVWRPIRVRTGDYDHSTSQLPMCARLVIDVCFSRADDPLAITAPHTYSCRWPLVSVYLIVPRGPRTCWPLDTTEDPPPIDWRQHSTRHFERERLLLFVGRGRSPSPLAFLDERCLRATRLVQITARTARHSRPV